MNREELGREVGGGEQVEGRGGGERRAGLCHHHCVLEGYDVLPSSAALLKSRRKYLPPADERPHLATYAESIPSASFHQAWFIS